jgi:hypothetical protein
MAGRMREQVRSETEKPRLDCRAAAGQYGQGGSLDAVWFRLPSGGEPVLRLPLAVSPVLRVPVHASMGMLMGSRRVLSALKSLAARERPVTYLLHGLDLLGADEFADRLPRALATNRGFRLGLAEKQEFLNTVLTAFKEMTNIQRSGDWIEHQSAPGS